MSSDKIPVIKKEFISCHPTPEQRGILSIEVPRCDFCGERKHIIDVCPWECLIKNMAKNEN